MHHQNWERSKNPYIFWWHVYYLEVLRYIQNPIYENNCKWPVNLAKFLYDKGKPSMWLCSFSLDNSLRFEQNSCFKIIPISCHLCRDPILMRTAFSWKPFWQVLWFVIQAQWTEQQGIHSQKERERDDWRQRRFSQQVTLFCVCFSHYIISGSDIDYGISHNWFEQSIYFFHEDRIFQD